MKIADLDRVTRKLIFRAHVLVSRPGCEALRRLRTAVREFDIAHAQECEDNLLRAIFGFPGSDDIRDIVTDQTRSDVEEFRAMRMAFAQTKTELLFFEQLAKQLVSAYDSDNRWPTIHATIGSFRDAITPMRQLERNAKCFPGGPPAYAQAINSLTQEDVRKFMDDKKAKLDESK